MSACGKIGEKIILPDGVTYEGNIIPRAVFEGKKEINIVATM